MTLAFPPRSGVTMFRFTSYSVNHRARLPDTLGQLLTTPWRRWVQGVAHLLVPPHCCLCDGPGQTEPAPWGLDLCTHCQAACPVLPLACPRCGTPQPSGRCCVDCIVRPPPFDALFAPCTYDAPADQLVRGLKFQGTLSHGRVLGLLLAAHRRAHCTPLPTLVVPMPLHRERFAERGFNQAEVIARAAAGALGLPVRSGLLQRLRGGARQSGLGAAARRANLQGAFEAGPLAGCGPIALVDDVFTTGSTARAAAQALKSAGAPRVEVWAATRALTMEDSPIC